MKKTIHDGLPPSNETNKIKYVTDTLGNDTFFPKGVHIDDIDRAVRDDIKSTFEVVSQGEKIPFLDIFSIQRFSEFMKTWQNTDADNTVKLPFLLMVREPAQKGTNLGGTFNIPNTPTYPVWKRNIVKNGKATVEYYQIAQPVNIDISYTLHLFTSHQREVNKLDELVLHTFKESQHYINVNGHQMPLKIEGMDDQSEISDIEKRRYYHKTYSMILKGYLLREEDFKKLPSIDNIQMKIEPSHVKDSQFCEVSQIELGCDLCLHFKFNRKSVPSKTYRIPMNMEFTYDNQNASNDYDYFLNGNLVSLPFLANQGDELMVSHGFGNGRTININVCGRKI